MQFDLDRPSPVALRDAFPVLFALDRFDRLIGAFVPNDDRAAAIFTFGNDAFKIEIVEGMIFDHHRQVLDLGIKARGL
jgi:hypothetical protein